MAYIPFHDICPKIAEQETRVISILNNGNEFGLPIGDYAFVELFCDECDCRRVFLHVFRNQENEATIAYGWASLSFYRKEFKGFSEKDIEELKGPTLELFQYQSNISGGIFKLFNKILFSDKAYLARIERHYNQFKKML
jgi:hypothetical protein